MIKKKRDLIFNYDKFDEICYILYNISSIEKKTNEIKILTSRYVLLARKFNTRIKNLLKKQPVGLLLRSWLF